MHVEEGEAGNEARERSGDRGKRMRCAGRQGLFLQGQYRAWGCNMKTCGCTWVCQLAYNHACENSQRGRGAKPFQEGGGQTPIP